MTFSKSYRRMRMIARARATDPIIQSAERQISSFILAQIALAGRPEGHLGRSGEDTGAEPRGYVFGVGEGVLKHNEIDPVLDDRGTIVLAIAFEIAYGPSGWNLAMDTLDEFDAADPKMNAGRARALADLDQVYRGQPHPGAGLFSILCVK